VTRVSRPVLRALYLTLALPLAAFLTAEALTAADIEARALARIDPFSNETLAFKALAETLTGRLYEGASAERAAMSAELAVADAHRHRAAVAGAVFAGLSCALVLTGGAPPASATRRADVLAVASVCLVPGLAAPVLTLASGADVPVVGRIVLSHESKSVLGVVERLFATGAFVPGTLVGAFSVVIPVLKLGTMVWETVAAASARVAPAPGVISRAVHHAGRWSMVDVFVVAIIVAFSAGRAGSVGETSLGMGVYFFAGYAVLSQLAAVMPTPAPARSASRAWTSK